MSDKGISNKPEETESENTRLRNRRKFLKLGGTGVAALALNYLITPSNAMAAAGGSPAVVQAESINLGTGDTAIMNYAYLLEQLEAAFYLNAANTIFAGATAEEQQIFNDLRDHEIIHREFFRAALGTNAIPTLQFDFSSVNFNNRDSVLTTAQAMEDTGVAAYNGVGQAVQSPDILALAGKIVSVEGRHAAVIRDLRIPRLTYFAPHSLDFALDPLEVLTKVAPFIPRSVTINASGLPRLIVV